MKDKKTKSKKGENIIGKIIYGFLLFMPLFAILSAVLVNVFNATNESATQIFYTAITDLKNADIFNWVQDSIIYTGLNSTCKALSITETFIPMILTYWLIISVIYFLYDIILMCVLILHNKIHDMQDSI